MDKLGWVGTYVLTGLAGLVVIFTQGPSIAVVLGVVYVIVWGFLVALGSALAVYGHLFNYRFEWVGLVLASSGLTIYALGVWALAVISPNHPYHTALIITAIAWAGFNRFREVGKVRKKLNAAVTASDSIESSKEHE